MSLGRSLSELDTESIDNDSDNFDLNTISDFDFDSIDFNKELGIEDSYDPLDDSFDKSSGPEKDVKTLSKTKTSSSSLLSSSKKISSLVINASTPKTFSSKEKATAQKSASQAVRAASAQRKKELIASGLSKAAASASVKKELEKGSLPGDTGLDDDRLVIDGVEVDQKVNCFSVYSSIMTKLVLISYINIGITNGCASSTVRRISKVDG